MPQVRLRSDHPPRPVLWCYGRSNYRLRRTETDRAESPRAVKEMVNTPASQQPVIAGLIKQKVPRQLTKQFLSPNNQASDDHRAGQGHISPARTANGRMLLGGGKGQMAKSVNAQGGEKARLKSSVMCPLPIMSPIKNRDAA